MTEPARQHTRERITKDMKHNACRKLDGLLTPFPHRIGNYAKRSWFSHRVISGIPTPLLDCFDASSEPAVGWNYSMASGWAILVQTLYIWQGTHSTLFRLRCCQSLPRKKIPFLAPIPLDRTARLEECGLVALWIRQSAQSLRLCGGNSVPHLEGLGWFLLYGLLASISLWHSILHTRPITPTK